MLRTVSTCAASATDRSCPSVAPAGRGVLGRRQGGTDAPSGEPRRYVLFLGFSFGLAGLGLVVLCVLAVTNVLSVPSPRTLLFAGVLGLAIGVSMIWVHHQTPPNDRLPSPDTSTD